MIDCITDYMVRSRVPDTRNRKCTVIAFFDLEEFIKTEGTGRCVTVSTLKYICCVLVRIAADVYGKQAIGSCQSNSTMKTSIWICNAFYGRGRVRLAITYHAVDNRRHAIIFIAEQVFMSVMRTLTSPTVIFEKPQTSDTAWVWLSILLFVVIKMRNKTKSTIIYIACKLQLKCAIVRVHFKRKHANKGNFPAKRKKIFRAYRKTWQTNAKFG